MLVQVSGEYLRVGRKSLTRNFRVELWMAFKSRRWNGRQGNIFLVIRHFGNLEELVCVPACEVME